MAIDTLGANALASNSVTTAKIAADAVTSAKIPADAVVASDIADGSITTAKLADNSVTSAKSVNLGRRNILINGAFQHWQRGTSFSSNVYGSDRWKLYAPGGHAYSRSTDTPDSPNNFEYSASVGGSGDATGLTQFVESRNAKHIPSSGSTKVILSFYLKHTTNSGTAKITSVVGTMDSADNSGASTNRSTQNHNTTTSWARYTHEMTGADLTAAVTNGLVVTIKHNGSGTTAFLLTGCQLEINETVTPFETRSIGEELTLCQRYYQKTSTGGAAYANLCVVVNYSTGTDQRGVIPFTTEMRVGPAISTNGNITLLGPGGGLANINAGDGASTHLAGIRCNSNSNMSTGQASLLRCNNDTTANIRFDSEI